MMRALLPLKGNARGGLLRPGFLANTVTGTAARRATAMGWHQRWQRLREKWHGDGENKQIDSGRWHACANTHLVSLTVHDGFALLGEALPCTGFPAQACPCFGHAKDPKLMGIYLLLWLCHR